MNAAFTTAALLLLSLCACGSQSPGAHVSIVTHGLAAADVAAIDLYLLDASGATRAKDCAALGPTLIALRSDVDVYAYQQLAPGGRASFPSLDDGEWIIVAEAYADSAALGAPVGRACARVPPIYRDEITRVTLVIEALP